MARATTTTKRPMSAKGRRDEYRAIVARIEAEGATTSDAQAAADVEVHERGICNPKDCALHQAKRLERVRPEVVSDALAELGLSRKEAATALGVTTSRISEMVSPKRPPRWTTVRKWAEQEPKLRKAAAKRRPAANT